MVVVSAAHRFSVCLDSGWAERKKKGETSPRCLGSLGLQAGSERIACRHAMVVCGELDRELSDPCILRLLAALEIGFPMLSWGGGQTAVGGLDDPQCQVPARGPIRTQLKPSPTTKNLEVFLTFPGCHTYPSSSSGLRQQSRQFRSSLSSGETGAFFFWSEPQHEGKSSPSNGSSTSCSKVHRSRDSLQMPCFFFCCAAKGGWREDRNRYPILSMSRRLG